MVDPLRHAIALIDSGDLKGGQAILLELVQSESNLEEAWMWLAASTDRTNVRRYYLNTALQINPQNSLAQQALADDWLSRDWLAEQLNMKKTQAAAAWDRPAAEPGPSADVPIQGQDQENQQPNSKSGSIPQALILVAFILAGAVALDMLIRLTFPNTGRVLASGLQAGAPAADTMTTRVSGEVLSPTRTPTRLPTRMPTQIQPTRIPTQTLPASPSVAPTGQPTEQPAEQPAGDQPPVPGPDSWTALPVIPTLSNTAREIYQKGLALGNNPGAFSKVGDCNSLSIRYLTYFDGDPGTYYNLETYSSLQAAIDQFEGSFKRQSQAVGDGFNTSAVLAPFRANLNYCKYGESPLTCEYRIQKPSFALIAIGTDDYLKPADFEANLSKIVETTIDLGIVPILATKSDNADQLDYNPIIARVAAKYDIPLWNLWRAMQPLPDHGLFDNMHPSGEYAAFDMTGDNLAKFGWPVRNLTALQALDAAWQGVTQP